MMQRCEKTLHDMGDPLATSIQESELRNEYRDALRQYLSEGGEAPLAQAYRIGHEALGSGHGLLDLIDVHQEAVLSLSHDADAHTWPERLAAIGRFLMESLSPFDMLQRGHREANAALKRLNEVLEEEAKRIAHSLHDEAAQMLATVYLEMGELKRDADDDVREHIARITGHLDRVREDLRRLSHELHPPILDQLGLVPALRFLADGVRRRTDLNITIESTLPERYTAPAETTVYRAVQEALDNIARHARARNVCIRLWQHERLVHCSVTDDGVGFHVNSTRRGLGLTGVRERLGMLHGTLQIESAPGRGTQLQITVPS